LIQTTLADNERARRDAEQRARDLEDQLQQERNKNKAPVNVTTELTRDDYFNDPINTINRLVSAQVKPLNEFTQEMQAQREYEQLKAGYRQQYPAFAQIESTVDQFMIGKPRNHAGMQSAIREAVGHLALTNPASLNPPTNNNPPAPTNPVTPTPKVPDSQAHLRPSNTPSITPVDNNPKRRPLTENERRLLREQNMTEERYWQLMEAGPNLSDFKEKAK
jgi:hypothetical protein